MKLGPVVLAGALGLSASFGGDAGAHEFRPGLLDVEPLGEGKFEIRWSPAPGQDKVTPVFPESCARVGSKGAIGERRFVIDCGPRGLAGQRISIAGMAPLRDEVLVRVRGEGGGESTAMLRADRPAMELPDTADPNSRVASRGARAAIVAYASAGIVHLATGPDHVLFLLGLLLLLRGRPRPVLWAVTAFTVAHSLSLALQVLGAVRLPPAPVEAAIALSVLLLAREILRPPGGATLAQRRPHLVTFAFGLLHGLGFAGGLSSLRVPEAEIPAALLGFNVGLEVAQIAVVGFALMGYGLFRRWLLGPGSFEGRAARLRRIPAYAIGSVAAYWVLARAMVL